MYVDDAALHDRCAGMIAKTGLEIGWEAIQELSDSTVEESVLETVRRCAQDSGGDIINVHDVRARRMGHYTLVDLHAVVSPRLSVSAAHQAGERIRHYVRQATPEISEVLVHIDPCINASWHEEDPSRLMRPHADIEADVRGAVGKVAEVHSESILFTIRQYSAFAGRQSDACVVSFLERGNSGPN